MAARCGPRREQFPDRRNEFASLDQPTALVEGDTTSCPEQRQDDERDASRTAVLVQDRHGTLNAQVTATESHARQAPKARMRSA